MSFGVCVCRESGVVLRLARSGGCSIRAGGVGQKAYRLKIQDSKTQKLMTQLSTDCAMTSHPLLTALLLIRFYLETVDLSVVQSRGCPQWCAEKVRVQVPHEDGVLCASQLSGE